MTLSYLLTFIFFKCRCSKYWPQRSFRRCWRIWCHHCCQDTRLSIPISCLAQGSPG